jgi:ABC-type maltose transport system permease subunit
MRPDSEAEYLARLPGSILVALPPIIVFFVLQKQFVAGLTMGATKG